MISKDCNYKDERKEREQNNIKELDRLLEDMNIDEKKLRDKCRENEDLKIVVSRLIKINPSRQGSLDEKKFLKIVKKN